MRTLKLVARGVLLALALLGAVSVAQMASAETCTLQCVLTDSTGERCISRIWVCN